MSRGFAVAGAIAAVVVGCALSTGGASAADRGCTRASVPAAAATLAQPDRSVLCLVNRERRARGLAALRASRTLARAARSHSRDMVARDYFSHVSRGGTGIRQRLVGSGYLRNGRQVATVGETITWAPPGPAAAPAPLVRSFMNSSGHRAVLLSRGYREIGIGLVQGAPVARPGAGSVTLTITFGRR